MSVCNYFYLSGLYGFSVEYCLGRLILVYTVFNSGDRFCVFQWILIKIFIFNPIRSFNCNKILSWNFPVYFLSYDRKRFILYVRTAIPAAQKRVIFHGFEQFLNFVVSAKCHNLRHNFACVLKINFSRISGISGNQET